MYSFNCGRGFQTIILIFNLQYNKVFLQSYFIVELLNLMKETENDELTAVIQKLVLKYQDDILPIAVDMVTHLATIFKQVGEVAYYPTCLFF